MRQSQARNLLPIVEAFANGETIQFRPYNSCSPWKDVVDPSFDVDKLEYRVKPKERYRPWTYEEVPIGAKVRTKLVEGNDASCYRGVITGAKLEARTGMIYVSIGGHSRVDVQTLLDLWTGDSDSSGDVCGKLACD